MLTMPTWRALGPDSSIMSNLNIILQLQQMKWILDKVCNFAEWTDAVQEVIHSQVKAISVPEGYSLEEVNHSEQDLA